ncbi:helix-turn-helix transcriptional regulator [Bradyrhizobium genosp. A]|uniref:helix-turn-helix transcriptional regulator n=1 Tax=Bradyrhizobium genosp. A TaxID=83626 RepID=UPI003CF1674A
MSQQHRPPVDTKGAAEYTGFTKSRLEKLRCTGDGPVFIKRGGEVRYDPDDLDAWLASLKRRSTSDVREVA